MTWDPDFGCPVHKGQPYDCPKCAKLPPPTMEELHQQMREIREATDTMMTVSGCICDECREIELKREGHLVDRSVTLVVKQPHGSEGK